MTRASRSEPTSRSAMARREGVSPVERDPRWSRVRARDASADGAFVYAVRTTGVYCRPSCGARLARPEHVAFHESAEAAERAGFRPCKRCKPRAPSRDARSEVVTAMCRILERAGQAPTLEALAGQVGLSPFHAHRTFKAATGLTPAQFARARRAERLRDELRAATSITSAIYGAGFSSAGRFYERSDAMLGMTPSRYRAGGAGVAIRFAVGQCTLGAILVAATDRGVCAILLGDDPAELVHDLERRFQGARLVGRDARFERTVACVVGLVERPGLGVNLPLDVQGTAFQQRVWEALRRVPAGRVVSYTELARELGAPRSVRAVAQACAANPLAVAIPCHRVVRRDGDLAGYRWGVERKRELLAREARE